MFPFAYHLSRTTLNRAICLALITNAAAITTAAQAEVNLANQSNSIRQTNQNFDDLDDFDNLQGSDLPTTTLDTITVTAKAKTGTMLAQKISEMPAVTQVIYEDEIQAQAIGNRTVGEVLGQLVPSLGTGSASTSNYGTTLHGRPVQYLLNGVPLTGSRDIARQLNSIDAKQLERVEVLSGATSIYGAGAAGGLINLVTKTSAGFGFSGQSRIGVSSNRNFNEDSIGYSVGQTLAYGGEQVYGRLDVDYETEGGKFDSNGNRISPDVFQTDQQDTKTISVNGNIGFDITPEQTISVAATYYNNEQDTDYGPDYGENLSVLLAGTAPSLKAVKGARVSNEPFTEKNTVNINYNHADIMGSNLSVTGYYRDEQGRFYPSGRDFVSQAQQVWVQNGLTDPATLKKVLGGAIIVAQSEADIEVMGVRAALQTETNWGEKNVLLSYGADFETEEDKQTYYGQDLNEFIASNGLSSRPNGISYAAGPDTTIDKLGAFINADIDLTRQWHASGGVRYQNIKAKTDAFTPYTEQLLENYFNDPRISPVSNAYGIDYKAGTVASGETDHSKTLFNLGTSYELTPNSTASNQVFANYSQGFTLPDVLRSLRDVRGSFEVNSNNVEPITINNYELGWQGKFADTASRLSAFYNTSDKVVRFNDDYTVSIVDTDERVYGVEGSIAHKLDDNWQIGGTLAYTRGQYEYKGDEGNSEWLELDAVRLTPLKGTAYAQYNFNDGSNIRLQMLAIDGTDRAYKDQQKDKKASAQPVTGYATFDLLGQAKLPVGRLDYGIYNLLNKDYKTVYHQTTYGNLNRMPAAGTTYGISYTIDY